MVGRVLLGSVTVNLHGGLRGFVSPASAVGVGRTAKEKGGGWASPETRLPRGTAGLQWEREMWGRWCPIPQRSRGF